MLSIVLVLGGCIIVTSLCLERILAIISMLPVLRHHQKLAYGRAEWLGNSTLHLQRSAHENLGLGDWIRTTKDVPVTRSQVKLAVLDINDTKHPRMRQPSRALDEISVVESNARLGPNKGYIRVPSVERK